jgi:hypothetical protein
MEKKMAGDKIPSYTDLVYQVVQASPEPLTFDEILQRVQALRPILTKNPKGTIRNAITQGRLIVASNDETPKRYGWMPRLLTGSVLRLKLTGAELNNQSIEYSDEVRDALWPSFFEGQKRGDRSPIHIRLPDGRAGLFTLEFLEKKWGTKAFPEFWSWLGEQAIQPGASLIVQILDGEAKTHNLAFEPQSARNETVIAERNQTIVQAALHHLQKSRYGVPIWDTTFHLLATGRYRHPVPPDPLSDIWTEEVWGPIVEHKTPPGMWQLIGGMEEGVLKDLLLGTEHGSDYEPDNPPDLPREYNPDYGRRPRPSKKGKHGQVKTYVLHVNHRALPRVWREIEIAEDQTLEDLHLTIQEAYQWNDDHLYSFFLSGNARDRKTEIGSPWSDTHRHTHRETIGSLDLKPGQKILYLFDYGDNHEFDVRVLRINPEAPRGNYPKIIEKQGQAPPQYPDYDEETGESEWDPYAHWG